MRQLMLCLLVVLATCGKAQEPPPPPPAPKPEPAPVPVKMVASDKGSCTLSSAGAFAGENTSPGGMTAIGSKYWLSDAEKVGAMPGVTINCTGKDVRLSIVAKPDATVPYGPKTYKVDKKIGELEMLGRAGKSSLMDFVGTIDITEFDGKHIAGTIAVTAKQIVGGAAVTLDGHFDFACPGYGNCVK